MPLALGLGAIPALLELCLRLLPEIGTRCRTWERGRAFQLAQGGGGRVGLAGVPDHVPVFCRLLALE